MDNYTLFSSSLLSFSSNDFGITLCSFSNVIRCQVFPTKSAAKIQTNTQKNPTKVPTWSRRSVDPFNGATIIPPNAFADLPPNISIQLLTLNFTSGPVGM